VSVLVFDNTVLSHFARAGQLAALQSLVASHRCVTPAEVIRELLAGVSEHPALAKAVNLSWVEVVELVEIEEVIAFARYKAEFGGGAERNNGEAAVLAWVFVHGGVAIVDERPATRAAKGLQIHGTLWLVTNGVREGKLSREAAEAMVDDLGATGMKLPVDGAGFFAWAYTEGLLP
jgi:predicted nucleic acid-binding protein